MFCFWQNFSIRSSLSKPMSNLECIWVAFWLWNDDTTPLMHLTRPSPPSSSGEPRLMNLMPKLLYSPNVPPRSTCWPWWQKWTCLESSQKLLVERVAETEDEAFIANVDCAWSQIIELLATFFASSKLQLILYQKNLECKTHKIKEWEQDISSMQVTLQGKVNVMIAPRCSSFRLS